MRVTVVEQENAYHIKVSGRESSQENVEDFKDAFERGIQLDSGIPLILDLKELIYLGSEGVGVIASAHKRLTEKGRQLIVKNPTRPVRRVLAVTRLDLYLNIVSDSSENPD